MPRETNLINIPPKINFYRRTLPDTCIAFSSDTGKQIFQEALMTGQLECYFKLAAQFRTQDEPAFCGLSTLVMILNALEVDPGQVWKGPWRWYHENMLDCCTPLEIVEQNGISFYQFICIASCNNLNVVSTRMTDKINVDEFRKIVIDCTKRDDCFLVCSYSRKILKQTGDGHFSPIGGYHPERDMVLLLDTARFKYPPHWIPLTLIFEAMKTVDKATGKQRGYMILRKQKDRGHLILMRIPDMLSVTSPTAFPQDVIRFFSSWETSLASPCAETTDFIDIVIQELAQSADTLKPNHYLVTMVKSDSESTSEVKQLIQELESIELYDKACRYVSRKGDDIFNKLLKPAPQEIVPGLALEHLLTFFLLSWPYSCACESNNILTLAGEMSKYVHELLASGLEILKNEVIIFSKQLDTIIDFNNNTKRPLCCKKSVGSKVTVT